MSRASQSTTFQPAREKQELDFEGERDAETTSWRRADPRNALIERLGRYGWIVTLPGGSAHIGALGRRDDGRYVGFCKCDGYRFHDGPCAHLCTLRKAEFIGAETTEGVPIEIARTAELDDRTSDSPMLSRLTDAERNIFKAVEMGDMGVREYQREQGWNSPGTAGNLLDRAREKLDIDEEHRQAQQSGEVFEGNQYERSRSEGVVRGP